MQILLTINDISITGGAERVCVNLADALTERGHSVEILSFYRANRTLPYDTKAKLTFMHDFDENILRDKMLSNPLKRLYFKNLHKIILSLKVWLRYKHIDMIITNDWTYMPIFRHGGGHYIKIQHSKFEGRYNKRNNLFDTLVVLSSRELPIWQRYHSNVRVIPNFIPNIPTQCTNHTQKVVLSVGRMDNGDPKGFLRLIDIWHIVAQNKGFADKEWRLIIVGDGVLKSEIQAKIHSLNLQDSIILKPFTKDIEREYLGASIYAMSSHFEGFPMVLVEACSYGLPCIAFDIATGPSDIIEHNKSGYLVSDNDLEGYAKHLIKLMSDEHLRSRFGTEAKKLVSERFSQSVVIQKWGELLETL